ncbi:hypothetical protein AMTRI_Chr02g220950 [Amborella trichopoda]
MSAHKIVFRVTTLYLGGNVVMNPLSLCTCIIFVGSTWKPCLIITYVVSLIEKVIQSVIVAIEFTVSRTRSNLIDKRLLEHIWDSLEPGNSRSMEDRTVDVWRFWFACLIAFLESYQI